MQSYTKTATFTITEARYVTSKIAADLQTFKSYYGLITDAEITAYAEEAAMLLSKGHLETVEYGLKRHGSVVFSLKYEAQNGMLTDERPGRIPSDLNVAGCVWYSFLSKSSEFYALPSSEQGAIEKQLPISRTTGATPTFSVNGSWTPGKSYSANSQGVARNVFKGE